jgi:hypothetical protein
VPKNGLVMVLCDLSKQDLQSIKRCKVEGVLI